MNRDAHTLALGSLERSLALSSTAGPTMLKGSRGLVAALGELGVLDAAEQRQWNACLGRAGRTPDPPGAEIHAQAIQLLDRELDHQQPASPGALNPLGRRERFTTKLQALLLTGIIGAEEQAGWLQKLDQALPDPPTPAAPPAYAGAELRGVAIGPDRRLGGLRINSAEMYDDCVILRWHLIITDNTDGREQIAIIDRIEDLSRAHGPSSLQDDLGTSYTMAPTGSWDWPDPFHLHQRPQVLPGATAFTPGTPANATRLTITCPAGKLQVDLGPQR